MKTSLSLQAKGGTLSLSLKASLLAPRASLRTGITRYHCQCKALEAPNSKSQATNKSQISITKFKTFLFDFWKLLLDCCLEFNIWLLEIPVLCTG
jgi:hypothetical protein